MPKATIKADKLYKTNEVASYLRVSSRIVRLWANEGKIIAFKVGRHYRFYGCDIIDFLLMNEGSICD